MRSFSVISWRRVRLWPKHRVGHLRQSGGSCSETGLSLLPVTPPWLLRPGIVRVRSTRPHTLPIWVAHSVPGPVTSASSVGCHRILREYGAVCVTNAAQMAELGGLDLSAGGVGGRRNPDECRTVDALDIRRVRSVENIAERAGLSVATVTAILGVLDIHGVAEQREEGWRLTRTHQTDDHCPV